MRKILEFIHFLPVLGFDDQTKRNPYSSTFVTVITPVASPAAKRNQCLHPTVHHCLSSASLFLVCKKGAAEMEFFLCPKAWWHPGYVSPWVTHWPWHRTWKFLPIPWSSSGPPAPGFAPTRALPLSGLYLASRLMNNPLVFQQNEPLPVSYLPIGSTEGAEEQRGIYPVLCSSPPEMAERAQQRGCMALKG